MIISPARAGQFFFLRDVLNGFEPPTAAVYSASTGSSFLKIKLLCLKLPSHLPLMPKLIILGAMLFLPPYTLMACIGSTSFCKFILLFLKLKPKFVNDVTSWYLIRTLPPHVQHLYVMKD